MKDQTQTAGESGTADKVKAKAGDVKAKAGEAKDQVQEKVASATAEVREQGEHLLDEGRDKARELGHEAEEKARSRADREKERVTTGMRSVADALRRGGEQLPEDRREYQPLLNGVANRVENASSYLDSRNVDDLTADVRRFARDHTPLFLGGAFALGLMGARFMKSSPEQARQNQRGEIDRYSGYDRHSGYGTQPGYATQAGYEGEDRMRTGRTLPATDGPATGMGSTGRAPDRGVGGGGYA